jgi:hypothetical protein
VDYWGNSHRRAMPFPERFLSHSTNDKNVVPMRRVGSRELSTVSTGVNTMTKSFR